MFFGYLDPDFFFKIMKMHNLRGDITDTAAKKKALQIDILCCSKPLHHKRVLTLLTVGVVFQIDGNRFGILEPVSIILLSYTIYQITKITAPNSAGPDQNSAKSSLSITNNDPRFLKRACYSERYLYKTNSSDFIFQLK